MKLPDYERALVPQAKITAYLLALNHEDGRSKARFFRRFGFTVERWEILAEALLTHAAMHEVTRIEPSPFGLRYVIEGIISTPDGRTPQIRAVRFMKNGEDRARFVMAYPLERSSA